MQVHLIVCCALEKYIVPFQEKCYIQSFLGVLGILEKTRDFEILIFECLKSFSNYVNMKKIQKKNLKYSTVSGIKCSSWNNKRKTFMFVFDQLWNISAQKKNLVCTSNNFYKIFSNEQMDHEEITTKGGVKTSLLDSGIDTWLCILRKSDFLSQFSTCNARLSHKFIIPGRKPQNV